MPPALARATCASVDLLESDDLRREHLNRLIQRFRAGARQLGYALMPSRTPIQPIMVGGNFIALALSQSLEAQGLLVTAIRPPTVPEGQARLRVTLSAAHTDEQLDALLEALANSHHLITSEAQATEASGS
jgi:8-amino-7-oxononanoate synthase